MAHRAEQKARARAEREALEQAQAAADRRRRRLVQLGAVLGLAALIVVVAIVVSAGGSKKAPNASSVSANRPTIAAVDSELRGIPQAGMTLGKASAPVTVNYYGDLECPICKDFTTGSLTDLVARDVRSGAVKVNYRSLQTATQDPGTFAKQQAAAYAAGAQNKGWNYLELFYREQGQEGSGYVDDSYLSGLARQTTGLNVGRWNNAVVGNAYATPVSHDERQATVDGFNSTPTLVVSGPKGKAQPITGAPSYQQLESAIHSVQ